MFTIFTRNLTATARKPIVRTGLAVLAITVAMPSTLFALNPSYAPGGNFDMEYWQLQLPIANGTGITTISSSQLQGQNGYQDPGHHYFFTESGDGAMVMKVPGDPDATGCPHTTNSHYCRTELREVNPSTGSATSWDPNAATNRLKATLAVTQADSSHYGTVIGQIHIDDNVSTLPVCELYYAQNGNITISVEEDRTSHISHYTSLGNVPLGQQFSYEIEYYNNQLKVAINGNFTTLSTYSLNAPKSYFKAGNYNQSQSASADPSDVHFLALTIQH